MEKRFRRRGLVRLAVAGVAAACVVAAVFVLMQPGEPRRPGSTIPCCGISIRWFIGLGSGTSNQIDAEKAFVTRYNSEDCHRRGILALDIVPNTNAYDVLKTQIAAGNAPDIIGPVGSSGRSGFEGLFLDLAPMIETYHTDVSGYDPALVDYVSQYPETGQVGLPYEIWPGYILYRKDLFAGAGLPALPARVGERYQGRDWTWDELADVARQLTVDRNGKNATQPGFDRKHIVSYGFDIGYADARWLASSFGGGSLAEPSSEPQLAWYYGNTAQIPEAWAYGWRWYYEAMWKGYFAPQGSRYPSDLGVNGHTAMRLSYGEVWNVPLVEEVPVSSWGIAVLPSHNGQTSSPVSVDTFVIPVASKHPEQAYQAIEAIMADQSLIASFGGMPARISDRGAYLARLSLHLPGNTIDWGVLGEMAEHPAVPSHEAGLPSRELNELRLSQFLAELQTTPNLDVAQAIEKLRAGLQKDFDGLV